MPAPLFFHGMTFSDEKLSALRPGRRVIVTEFFKQKAQKGGSISVIARRVAKELNYSVDRNGTNTFIVKVIREYQKS